MTWKQTTIPRYSDPKAFQEALYAVAMAQAKTGQVIDTEIALFCRDDEEADNTVLLLSPHAAQFTNLLEGEWTDAGDPREHGWSLLYSAGAGHKDFGLKAPHDL